MCGNCLDDDGDGLVDAEDPECCTAEPLTVTQRALPAAPKSTLRVNATMPDGTFAGLDPRHQDVRLQIRTAARRAGVLHASAGAAGSGSSASRTASSTRR